MDSRIRFLTLLAIAPLLALIALLAYWIYNQMSAPPMPTPIPPTTVPVTESPTVTPTVTETPVPISFATVPPPPTTTPTPTPTPTATRTPVPTETPIPTNTRAVPRPPTQTPTPAPTPTEIGGQYRFKPEGSPLLFRDRPCQAQHIIFGWVKGRDGIGLPNMLLRYIPKYGRPPELPAITRSAPDPGYYELTVGASGNEWDIFIVDAADQPLSPVVRFAVPQQVSGECWWLLNWIER